MFILYLYKYNSYAKFKFVKSASEITIYSIFLSILHNMTFIALPNDRPLETKSLTFLRINVKVMII